MNLVCCGIDFGTSNTSVALAHDQGIELATLENGQKTIPSAIFFPQDIPTPLFGREATQEFFTKRKGRYMRSLKRILGTSPFSQGTLINGKVMGFDRIISLFLKNIKDKADAQAGCEIEQVVMGRPVHFVDNNPQADRLAEQQLGEIARSIGFKQVAFQFEPIAAAFAHEANLQKEKLALVADLGGGTSDFTVIKLSSQKLLHKDRTTDILANSGVRVGGNDFDKQLSLWAIMPQLGYKSTYGEKKLEVPIKLYQELSEWSKVNFLYTTKIITQARQLLHQSHEKRKLSRLLKVLEQERGHLLLAGVEDTKIALTLAFEHCAWFDFIEADFRITTHRKQFEEAIGEEVEKITAAANECIRQAGISRQEIELIILTGGSTEVPLIQDSFRALFANATLADENKLSSVGLGLGYASYNTFR
ncbi:Hsp70 family protein [Rhodocytophaga rosea]|uniref:Hsp70 family protein n=1 Tax=Rhodocytophaga rosea TaxID=2704465 RepID=A0A6C0GEA9_9BACT|nr:Hsp70 family protein [Rhodocytophaga rosea]QHT66247.1 Hsp70 family protein [Rhodocytophaga rosea]